MKTLLINHVCWNPVGHVVEAMKKAKGFKSANKDLEIHLLLNKRTAEGFTIYHLWKKQPSFILDIFGNS
jgi:hypothetical protein